MSSPGSACRAGTRRPLRPATRAAGRRVVRPCGHSTTEVRAASQSYRLGCRSSESGGVARSAPKAGRAAARVRGDGGQLAVRARSVPAPVVRPAAGGLTAASAAALATGAADGATAVRARDVARGTAQPLPVALVLVAPAVVPLATRAAVGAPLIFAAAALVWATDRGPAPPAELV